MPDKVPVITAFVLPSYALFCAAGDNIVSAFLSILAVKVGCVKV